MDLIIEKSVSEAAEYRRSMRVFKNEVLNDEKVKECIRFATLSPTSSNMQLWNFDQITAPEVLEKITKASFTQNASKTASQMVIVVARKALWKKRVQSNVAFLKSQYWGKSFADYSKREKFAFNYYQKVVPTLYFDFMGFWAPLNLSFFKLSECLNLFIDKSERVICE
jgi:nitroreductase